MASVRLHPIARFLRDQRGRRHDAVVAKLPDQPIAPVSRRPRLVAKRQLTVFGRKFGDELARRRFRGVDLAKIANVPPRPSSATATALRNFDVSIPTKARLCWSTTRASSGKDIQSEVDLPCRRSEWHGSF